MSQAVLSGPSRLWLAIAEELVHAEVLQRLAALLYLLRDHDRESSALKERARGYAGLCGYPREALFTRHGLDGSQKKIGHATALILRMNKHHIEMAAWF